MDSGDSQSFPENELNGDENDVELIADKRMFAIAINNLVLNGIQAVEENGSVEVTLKENTDEITIKIKDSGDRIPKMHLKKIFQPLFTTKQHGTGLGLASVKSIIESHEGTITASSPPTIFTIKLPKE